MSYIGKIVSNQERILLILRPHWIYVVEGLFWFGLFWGAGLAGHHYLSHYLDQNNFDYAIDFWFFKIDETTTILPWVFGTIGGAIFVELLSIFLFTEVALTNHRIIYKKGFLAIEADQVDLEDIRAEQVFHGWLGWLLGYGRIHLDCRFVKDVWLPAFSKPYRLLRASHIARMRHPEIDYDHVRLSNHLAHLENEEKRYSHGLATKMKRAWITTAAAPGDRKKIQSCNEPPSREEEDGKA